MYPKTQKLEEKLRKHFKEAICIEKGSTNKKSSIVYSTVLSLQDALLKQNDCSADIKNKIKDVAFILRAAIRDAERRPLRQNITLEEIQNSEVDVPELVDLFGQFVVCGPVCGTETDSRKRKRRATSIAEDLVFGATGGRKKNTKTS